MENKENRELSEQQFRQALAEAMGLKDPPPLPPAPEPVQLRLPDIERWLENG